MIPRTLFELNPSLDRRSLQERFAADRRVQIRDVLAPEAAREVHKILSRETPWGIAWRAGQEQPRSMRSNEVRSLSSADQQLIGGKIDAAMRGSGYAFVYSQYPMLDAYLQKWAEGGPHDLLLEHINSEPFLNLVREVASMPDLIKADAQATLYGPNQFLALHDDGHVEKGWRVAYVLNFCLEEWRPDWGGYLNFYDAEGDVIAGFKPRFNALNLFAVPQRHNVTYVPPFAPLARLAITGWFQIA